MLSQINLSELDIETLRSMEFETDVFLFSEGKEDFTLHYKTDPRLFKQFIREQVKLKNKFLQIFTAMRTNLSLLLFLSLVRADEIQEEIYPELDNLFVQPAWEKQAKENSSALFGTLFSVYLIGMRSGQKEFKYHSPLENDQAPIIKKVKDWSTKLGNDLNETTKNTIMQQVKTSIDLGETRDLLTQRLNDLLNNENRAVMIAQTESVRMFEQARYEVATEVGYTKKTWTVSGNACPICEALSGITVKIDEDFKDGISEPPAHPRCKCSASYHN